MARVVVGTTDTGKAKEDDKKSGHEGPYMPCQESHMGLERQVRSRRQDVSECYQDHCCFNG